VWSGPPVDPQPTDWQHDQSVADLVHEVAQRREPLAQAQGKIHTFAEQADGHQQQKLLELVSGLFNLLDDERSAVIAGLDRFGARQKELAAQIREDNDKLRQLQADAAADRSQVNQMVQKVTWEAEVFQDRRQALSYACDVPGKIEQRLFALAKTIQQELQ
jgi:predicted  nucleic acid-binding Zn-ribbon protein